MDQLSVSVLHNTSETNVNIKQIEYSSSSLSRPLSVDLSSIRSLIRPFYSKCCFFSSSKIKHWWHISFIFDQQSTCQSLRRPTRWRRWSHIFSILVPQHSVTIDCNDWTIDPIWSTLNPFPLALRSTRHEDHNNNRHALPCGVIPSHSTIFPSFVLPKSFDCLDHVDRRNPCSSRPCDHEHEECHPRDQWSPELHLSLQDALHWSELFSTRHSMSSMVIVPRDPCASPTPEVCFEGMILLSACVQRIDLGIDVRLNMMVVSPIHVWTMVLVFQHSQPDRVTCLCTNRVFWNVLWREKDHISVCPWWTHLRMLEQCCNTFILIPHPFIWSLFINKSSKDFLPGSSSMLIRQLSQRSFLLNSIRRTQIPRLSCIFSHHNRMQFLSIEQQRSPRSIDVHIFTQSSTVISTSASMLFETSWSILRFRIVTHSIPSAVHGEWEFALFSRWCLSVHLCR